MGASFTTRLASAATRCGFAVGCFAVRVLPRHWLFRLADGLASLAYLLFKGFRSRSRKNIAAAFDEKLSGTAVENIARRSLRNFFRDCVEIGIVLESSEEEVRVQVPIIGKEYLDTALEKGSGVVVLSAHLGNFFRSEEHTSELQSHVNLVCRLLLEKKKHALYQQNGRLYR